LIINYEKYILIILVLISCKSSQINLGDEMIIVSQAKYYLPTLTFHNYKKIEIKNIEYVVAVGNINNVIYISTNDEKFKTSKLNMNSTLKEIPHYKDSLISDTPWGAYYIKVSKNWYAGFNNKTKPDENSKIGWFFKYDFPKREVISESKFKEILKKGYDKKK
jgi:hypothetical protein